jgi:hypothetical protein
MQKKPIRKFADLSQGRDEPPQKSVLKSALQRIAQTEDGEVLERYFLSILSSTLAPDASEGALRENMASRRMALELTRLMAQDEATDGGRVADPRR